MEICLSQLDSNAKLAVAISREHALSNRLISASQIYCFHKRETIYKYPVTFIVRKHSRYITKLNEMIQLMTTNGIIEKWQSNFRYQDQTRLKYKETNYHQLTAVDLLGGLTILAYVELMAFVTLVFEVFIYRKTRKTNCWRLWLLIEMLIDPYRHFLLKDKKLTELFYLKNLRKLLLKDELHPKISTP